MLRCMLEGKVNTIQEFKEFAEKNMDEFSDLHKECLHSDLFEKVNFLFEKKEENMAQKLLFLLKDEEYRTAKELTEQMEILEKFCMLAEIEQSVGREPMLFKFSTLDEMEEIYHRTVFYLRRIEVKREAENSEAFLDLLKTWNFSLEYIFMVFKNVVIFNKFRTYWNLVHIFAENNYEYYYEGMLKEVKYFEEK